MKRHTKEFGIYHWDTFDNETILIAEADTLPEAEAKVTERYGGRVGPSGADKVEIVDRQGNVQRSYSVS